MRKVTLVLAACLAVVAAQSAQATPSVFFTATVSSGPASVTGQGSVNGTLQLACATGATNVRCVWVVSMMLDTLGNPAGNTGLINGWAVDLRGDAVPKIDAKSWTYTHSPAPNDLNTNTGAFSTPNNAAGDILVGASGSNPAGVANGVYELGRVVISVVKTPNQLNTKAIFARVGDNEWGDGGGQPQVKFGANAPVDGTAGSGDGPLPVIIIRNTPEPATISLIGLGMLGLIRRRRA